MVHEVISVLGAHDLLAIFVVVFLASVGLPVPALPVLLLAGSHATAGGVFGFEAMGVAVVASLIPATAWFVAGQRFGRKVLALLCRISISPDTCVRKSELSFASRGPLTLVMSKVVPGLSMLAPPVAGALGMRIVPFLIYRTAGTVLWAAAGIGAGVIFRDGIVRMLAAFLQLGAAALVVAALLLVIYVGFRLWTRRRVTKELALIDRILASELAASMGRESKPVIIDVRSLISRSDVMSRVPGALHFDLASLDLAPLHEWPADAPIVTYCDCPNDVTAARAAQILARRGRKTRVLEGGLASWQDAGYPIEAIEG
ncbi:DedA family protein/thiosulfate sulfurtransferase GlpE [soil metagenome]